VGDNKLLGDFGAAVAEGDLTEYAVGKGFGEGFAEGDVVRKEDYMGYVCGCKSSGPVVR
jgi:hypothetical protein